MLQKGFTLIELMIVVAIIGILSMFALPAYQDYTKRTYVSEGMALASAAKMASTEYFSTQGEWASNNNQAGLPAPNAITGQSVEGISLRLGKTYTKASGATKSAATGNEGTNIVILYNTKVVASTNLTSAGSDATQPIASNPSGSVTLAPVDTAASAGSIEWICSQSGTGIQAKWLPANCRAQATTQ